MNWHFSKEGARTADKSLKPWFKIQALPLPAG